MTSSSTGGRIVVLVLFWASLLAWVLAAFQRDALPARRFLASGLLKAPIQTATASSAPLRVIAKGRTYVVEPMFDYDLRGMVVSLRHSDAWYDYQHKERGDYLNVASLCVVYGRNIQGEVYRKLYFSSAADTCAARPRPQADASDFADHDLSNNHILTNDPALIKKIRQVRPGDQIHLQGFLARYYLNDQPESVRTSSVTRNDTGLSASEIVYVKDFRILATAQPFWRQLFVFAGFLTGFLFLLVLKIPEAVLFCFFPPKPPPAEDLDAEGRGYYRV